MNGGATRRRSERIRRTGAACQQWNGRSGKGLMMAPAERTVTVEASQRRDASMPVTARLSRRFYDAIGDDAANDLVNWMNDVDATYRTDLLRLNEANLDRFSAEIERHAAVLRAEMDRGLGELRAEMDRGLGELRAEMDRGLGELRAEMDRRLGELRAEMDRRLGELRAEMDRGFGELRAEMDRRLGELSAEMARGLGELRAEMRTEFAAVDVRFAQIDTRLAKFEARMLRWMLVFWTGSMVGAAATIFAVLRTH
ncbi:MAG TPA: hypothetical protein VG916_16120 [Gemmatimonadaceae bacterium]|nr:hypothetical protein [Gemmatimonadaceae bacterium]